jgi:hypothetical protein
MFTTETQRRHYKVENTEAAESTEENLSWKASGPSATEPEDHAIPIAGTGLILPLCVSVVDS